MNRRNFIEKSTILGATALLPLSSCSAEKKAKFKMGYQLYSIRDEMAKDPIATLKALKNMGYEDFETYGYNPDEDTFYGYKSKEFKMILDDLQLTTSSGHFGFSPFLSQSDGDLNRFVDQAIIGAKALNMKYITWPWIAPELRTIDNFKLMAGKLNGIGEQISATGLGFAYHNHGFEFIDHNGENAFDIILKETDPALVKLEMDMYWVRHSSNFTPKELVEKQPGRYVMWHIKDMDKVSRDYTELGNGSIDYPEMLPDPIESGLEFYFIEQGGNYAHNSTRSAADSASYFKKHLQKIL
jgi:sugar phosphate isomerase/epimerase